VKRRSTAGGKLVKTLRRKTVTPKRGKAPKVTRSRPSSAAGHEAEIAQLTRERDEALEQQATTSEILKVISRSTFDLQPVLESLLEKAVRLCGADRGLIMRQDGDLYRVAASYGHSDEFLERVVKRNPIHQDRSSATGRAVLERRVVHIHDTLADPEYRWGKDHRGEEGMHRTILAVPMLKGDTIIGVILIRRTQVQPFTDMQIALLSNFAAQAVIAIENTRLFQAEQQRTRELTESLEQQTATSEVLSVISRSPGELAPVFDTMLANATRLCEATHGNVWRFDGEQLHAVAVRGDPGFVEWLRQHNPVPPIAGSAADRIVRGERVVHVTDRREEDAYRSNQTFRQLVDTSGVRASLSVALCRDETLLGMINVYRQEVRPFSEKQIALLQNFAAQAVIAIENTRLLNELRESLAQQTATSEVLKVISSSPGDLKPVFNAMLENAARLCEAQFGNLLLCEGDGFRFAATHNVPPIYAELSQREPIIHPAPLAPLSRAVATGEFVHIVDLTEQPAYKQRDPPVTALVDVAGARTLLIVPMLKDGAVIGALGIFRQEVRPFTDKQIALVQNFAAQAVIAIENTRLLSELRESLQRQTATTDVLKVISRSTFDLQAVLDTLVESAMHLGEANAAAIWRPENGALKLAASHGMSDEFVEFARQHPITPSRGTISGRVVLEGKTAHVPDVLADSEFTGIGYQSSGNYRTNLGVPLSRNGKTIGVFMLARWDVRPFTDKQIELVQTFADQAVIAIENVRLFEAEQQRTRELRESLEQQTATSEVLKVISSSPGDLQPVFETMLEKAVRICDAKFGNLWLREGDTFSIGATHGAPPAYVDYLRRERAFRQDQRLGLGQLVRTKQMYQVADLTIAPAHEDKLRVATIELAGARTLIGVPLLKDDEVIGCIVIYRQEVRPFTDKQIALVTSFASQAVIAIENTRLLSELRQRTADLTESLQQQTATADVLKVISRSAFDLKTVLDTLVEAAAQLCEADQGTIARERDGVYQRVATYGFSDDFTEYVRTLPVIPERGTATGRALLEGKVVHIPDVRADPEYTFAEAQKLGGFRTILSLPMLREGVPIGVLALTRHEVRPFTDKQIELVSTFADQAAIAIENVRLFESIEARTRELAKSLEDLRTAQDRLVQTEKLASLGQLTAGIAHEIKNPLNFVNNFSAVSVELIDELREALGGAHLDSKLRAEISEIADTLQANLDKVVQHGKRADAIVKNMLLHSRQGSGEHRLVDINALVEESLNLAYHGARAEKQGFNITMQRSFDPAAGEVDLFPQEITRVLLNLISNGFYAATMRKVEANGGDYEPTLAAATKNLGDSVEISIRDNGTGIPPEVKEKMFNPFFTTKPAGEGTGLGLSISHDIIVKQHGGSIEVDTQPGVFTEFRIVLPRAGASLIKSGERA
jgi:GAF domain-containing protein